MCVCACACVCVCVYGEDTEGGKTAEWQLSSLYIDSYLLCSVVWKVFFVKNVFSLHDIDLV